MVITAALFLAAENKPTIFYNIAFQGNLFRNGSFRTGLIYKKSIVRLAADVQQELDNDNYCLYQVKFRVLVKQENQGETIVEHHNTAE